MMTLNKSLLISLVAAAALLVAFKSQAQKKPAALAKPLITLEQKASYAIGRNFAKSLQQNGVKVDIDALTQALIDVRDDKKPKLNDAELAAVMQTFQEQLMAKQQAGKLEAAKKNLAEGAAFLAENKAKPGVVETASGLQYRVIKAGTGPLPRATSNVTVHYVGKLIDGKEFDSSYSRNQPASFGVSGVIPGWTEALQLMPQGSKWELVIPANLGYGEAGGGPIPPNAVLVFEVELFDIK